MITADQVRGCFSVMKKLRPDLRDEDSFTQEVLKLQQSSGYHLLAVQSGSTVLGLIGFRRIANLMHGPHIYVDDLVTLEEHRSRGIGGDLLDAVLAKARELGCKRVLLDTGIDNREATDFYLRRGFLITANRFTLIMRQPVISESS